MLKDYEEGSLSFNDQRFSSWLAMKTGRTTVECKRKKELEKSLIKYVETIVGRIFGQFIMEIYQKWEGPFLYRLSLH